MCEVTTESIIKDLQDRRFAKSNNPSKPKRLSFLDAAREFVKVFKTKDSTLQPYSVSVDSVSVVRQKRNDVCICVLCKKNKVEY